MPEADPSPRLVRRAALCLIGAAALPGLARGQTIAPAPSTPVPTQPQLAQPTGPVRQRAPSGSNGAPAAETIDRSKIYYVFFDQIIDVASMRALRQQLAKLVEAGVSDITLVIDSPGGLVGATLITYGFIRALPARITTHAQGFVQSAATILFLAGEQRSADRAARFLFHPAQVPVGGIAGEQQLDEQKLNFDTVNDVMVQIYRDRTTLSDQEINRFHHGEVIYTAEQARGFGIIQTVGDLRIPGDQKARILFIE